MVSEEGAPVSVVAPDSEAALRASEAALLSEPPTRVSELRRGTVERQCLHATQFMRRSAAPRMSRSATPNMRMFATPCSSES